MAYRFKQARETLGWSAMEMAGRMEVEVSNIHNWEAGRRQPTLERLLQMSQITGYSVSWLLGAAEDQSALTGPVEKSSLALLNRQPVWLSSRGWALLDWPQKQLVFCDKSTLDIAELNETVYAFPPPFAQSLRGSGEPLSVDMLRNTASVWVEPLGRDERLNDQLRGWYHPKDRRLVENEFGQRFYLDTYGSKWLAFAQVLK